MMKLIVDENLLSFKVLEQKVCDKCSLPVPLDSSNSVEKLCDEWVLSTSVCVARSPVDFCYATTEAERRPLVVSVPIPLRTQRARVPTRRKAFLRNYGKQKKCQRTLDTNLEKKNSFHLYSLMVK